MSKNTLDLAKHRDMLLALRAELVGDSEQMRRDAMGPGPDASGSPSHAPIHLADAASDTHDQEFTLERLGSSSETLQLIDEALDRIEEGTYGQCEECGESIGERRLQIRPYACLCVGCKRKEEEA